MESMILEWIVGLRAELKAITFKKRKKMKRMKF